MDSPFSAFADSAPTYVNIQNKDAKDCYTNWPAPMTIISDGPYGVKGYPGDLPSPDGLAEWYEPHIKAWTEKSTPMTTLWFWNTEIGWATVHPVLEKYGWQYVGCNTWDKGISHIAGNVNTQTIRRFPPVTEVCVQYVRKPIMVKSGKDIPIQQWLHDEWARTGLPFRLANEACGVKNAATRKYLTLDLLWYMPSLEKFERMVEYANAHGDPAGRPYFDMSGSEYEKLREDTNRRYDWLRGKAHCPFGTTNVWHVPQLRDKERIKVGQKALHLNQKPTALIEQIVRFSTDEEDVVWDPFAGLGTVSAVCMTTNRKCYAAEINKSVYEAACERLLETFDTI